MSVRWASGLAVATLLVAASASAQEPAPQEPAPQEPAPQEPAPRAPDPLEHDASPVLPFVDRPMTLGASVLAGNLGLAFGHAGTTGESTAGAGMSAEVAFGITERVEVGLRSGARFGNNARLLGADLFARTVWTETYGVGVDPFANPELRTRWSALRTSNVELGLDGRVYLPFEAHTAFSVMAGMPFTVRAGHLLRIDTGLYLPMGFGNRFGMFVTAPTYVWFQPSDRVWLGPIASLRIPAVPTGRDARLLVGGALGISLTSGLDLKVMAQFPNALAKHASRLWGFGFGLEGRFDLGSERPSRPEVE